MWCLSIILCLNFTFCWFISGNCECCALLFALFYRNFMLSMPLFCVLNSRDIILFALSSTLYITLCLYRTGAFQPPVVPFKRGEVACQKFTIMPRYNRIKMLISCNGRFAGSTYTLSLSPFVFFLISLITVESAEKTSPRHAFKVVVPSTT